MYLNLLNDDILSNSDKNIRMNDILEACGF